MVANTYTQNNDPLWRVKTRGGADRSAEGEKKALGKYRDGSGRKACDFQIVWGIESVDVTGTGVQAWLY
jgi:hypothetical protein